MEYVLDFPLPMEVRILEFLLYLLVGNLFLAREGLLFLVIEQELSTVILCLLMRTDALLIELDGGAGQILPVCVITP